MDRMQYVHLAILHLIARLFCLVTFTFLLDKTIAINYGNLSVYFSFTVCTESQMLFVAILLFSTECCIAEDLGEANLIKIQNLEDEVEQLVENLYGLDRTLIHIGKGKLTNLVMSSQKNAAGGKLFAA